MTPEQEAIIEKFKEIWIMEEEDLKSFRPNIPGYYVIGLLLDVFKELNKDKS